MVNEGRILELKWLVISLAGLLNTLFILTVRTIKQQSGNAEKSELKDLMDRVNRDLDNFIVQHTEKKKTEKEKEAAKDEKGLMLGWRP